jgi:hypothetical protein
MEKNIIKNILLEVSGISFEVRNWAKVIEDYVSTYIKNERQKSTKTTPIKPQPKNQTSSFFETEDGVVYHTAKINGSDLEIADDILSQNPNIGDIIEGRVLELKITKDYLTITNLDDVSDKDLYLIEVIVDDHVAFGGSFYNEKDQEVFFVDKFFGNPMQTQYPTYTPPPKIDLIEIDGREFPEVYKDFKVDKWVITSSSRIEYDHWKSGYDENGKYVVYLNMPMSSIGGSALIHEIKHAYDDWNRMSRGAKPIRDSWEIKNIYTPDFEKLVLGGSFKFNTMLQPIIRYYYLGSKLETPAYLENNYDDPSKMGQYRDTAKKMMNFKAQNFKDKKGNPAKGLQESWTELITTHDIPFFRKFKNVLDFLEYTEKHFNKRGRDILRRIDKMRYIHNKPQQTTTTTQTYGRQQDPESEKKWYKESLKYFVDKFSSIKKEYEETKDPYLKRLLTYYVEQIDYYKNKISSL